MDAAFLELLFACKQNARARKHKGRPLTLLERRRREKRRTLSTRAEFLANGGSIDSKYINSSAGGAHARKYKNPRAHDPSKKQSKKQAENGAGAYSR